MNVMKLGSSVARLRSHLQHSYALDPRSLAVFRIAVGFVVLIDLIRRFQHSVALYSDDGIFTRSDAILRVSSARWSVFFINGSPEFVNIVLGLGIFAAIAMIVGWKTRIVTIVLWIIILSVQVRNIGVNDGADNLIRLTLFWSMFLPLGRMWSIEGRLDQERGTNRQSLLTPIATLAGFGLILQQAYMYLFTAMLKEGPQWTQDSTALYYALGMNHVSRGFGDWLFLNAPMWLLVSFTTITLILEYAVPMMLLLPIRNSMLRISAVFLIWTLHLGILGMMNVELFPLISIASAMGLMPAFFWDSLVPRVSAVFSRIAKRPLPAWRTDTFVPGSVTSLGRSHVDTGNWNLHFVPPPVKSALPPSTITTFVCAVAIVLSTLSNVANVSSYTVPSSFHSVTYAAGLQQSWRMFAPQPGGNTIWYVIEGELKSGKTVDLLVPIAEDDMSLRLPVVWDQSDNVLYPSKFWRKYLGFARNREVPKAKLASYACRSWNQENSGDDRLVGLTMARGTARTLPNSERAEPVFTDLGSWNCT